MGNNTNRLAAMHDRWWDAWAALCRETLPTHQAWDLAGAVIKNGRTAVVVWHEVNGMVTIAIDQPLADALVATDSGFLITQWLRQALGRFQRRPTLTMVRIPRAFRKMRRERIRF